MKFAAPGRLQITFWALGALCFVGLASSPNLLRFFAVDHYGYWVLDSAAFPRRENLETAVGVDQKFAHKREDQAPREDLIDREYGVEKVASRRNGQRGKNDIDHDGHQAFEPKHNE